MRTHANPSRSIRAAVLLLTCLSGAVAAQTIQTYAGGGTGDGQPGKALALSDAYGSTLDAARGILYFAERDANIIRKLNLATGTIGTLAGNSGKGFSGDGGPAIGATLNGPTDVTLDSGGNIYVADAGNGRVRRVDALTGFITTFAGGGAPADGVGDGGPATAALLNSPWALAFDANGDLYIADPGYAQDRVRRVSRSNGLISTVAGGSTGFGGDGGAATAAKLNRPLALVLDAASNLFIADAGNNRIRRVDAATRNITTVAGDGTAGFGGDGGPATAAQLAYPSGLAFDRTGKNLLIADTQNHRVRRLDTSTGLITTIAGNGSYGGGNGLPATEAGLIDPRGLSIDSSGALYIVDFEVRRVEPGTTLISTVAGGGSFIGDAGPATAAILRFPAGLVTDASGDLFIADFVNRRIRRVASATKIITTYAGNGDFYFGSGDVPATSTSIGFPRAVAFDAAGNLLIADYFNGRVYRVDRTTGILKSVAGGGSPADGLGDGGLATAAEVAPYGVASDSAGNIYVADRDHHRIRRIDSQTGIIRTIAGTDPKGSEGGFSGDGGPAAVARLSAPTSVAFDRAGDLFISDTGNNAIRKITISSGTIQTFAGHGNPPDGIGDNGLATGAFIRGPQQIAFDKDGNLLITESNRVRRVDRQTALISTIAGGSTAGFLGDGGAATAARLSGPQGVTADSAGNLFISDTDSHRIRIIPAGAGCPIPTITSQPEGSSLIAGQAAVLTVSASGTGTLSYQWFQGLSGDTSRPVAGATSTSLTTAPLSATTSYWVRVKDRCGQVDSLTATVTISNSLADLSLEMSVSSSPVAVGARLTYTIIARNNGPTAATGVTVTDTLPSGVTFVSASSTQGTCSGALSLVCTAGNVVPGAAVTVTLVVTPTVIETITNRARVSANEPDPDLNNNTASYPVVVSSATAADLSVIQSDSPDPVRVGQTLTYTLFVQNSGPAPATGIVLTNTLPAGVTFGSVSPLQGTCTGTSTLTCALGSLLAGGSTTITLVVTPGSPSTLQNMARVTGAEQDPDPTNNTSEEVTVVLSNAAQCPAPPPVLASTPDGIVRAGDSFTISWNDVYGPTDPDGLYLAQLSLTPDFATNSLVSSIRTRNLSLSFPTEPGTNQTLFFRISSLASCGQPGGFSLTATINVAPNPPAIVVTQEQEPDWVVRPGETPPAGAVKFKNIGGSSTPVQFRASGDFFTYSPTTALLAPGQEITIAITALPGFTTNGGTLSGDLAAVSVQGTVSAGVVLSVTSTFASDGVATVDQDEVLIINRPASPGAPRKRKGALADPLPKVTVTNFGKTPIFLVPSLSPGGAWLKLDSNDFSTPLPAGASRTVKLATDASRITSADYPFPIWTVLSIAAAGGSVQTEVKIFYQDAATIVPAGGRGFLPAGSSSFVIPTAVHKEGAGGTLFTSDGWIRNLSPGPVALDLFVTPSGQDGQVTASHVKQSLPGFATLRLFDFVQGLFGNTDLAGPVEIRSSDASQISVRVNASGLPGSGDISSRYGTEIPVYGAGTGTGMGRPALVLTGIKSTSAFRLNVILTETIGTSASVRLRLFDSAGTELATKIIAVPAAGNTQFALLDMLGIPGTQIEAGSLVVEPAGGSGRVVAIGTLIDNASSSFQSLSGRAFQPATASPGITGRLALPPQPRVIPSIVHSKGIGAYFTTEVSITNPTASPAPLHLVYDYAGSDGAGNPISGTATADVVLAGRASLTSSKSRDAIVNLFGLPANSNTAGPMRIEGSGVNSVAARATVTTPVDLLDPTKGVKGSEFQSYSARSAEAVSLVTTPVAIYPGLQKFPGIRTNLILAEVSGEPANVRIRLVNGTSGGVVAQVDRKLAGFERVQINDIWNGNGGFDVGTASFDRISISLESIGSERGSVLGALSIIDNLTNSSRILVMQPPGPPQPSGIGF